MDRFGRGYAWPHRGRPLLARDRNRRGEHAERNINLARVGLGDRRYQPTLAEHEQDRGEETGCARGGNRLINIESRRFILRPLTPDDVDEDYIGWWNDTDIQAGLNSLPRNWERFHALRHVRRFNNRDRFHLGLFRKDGPLIGFLALFLDDKLKIARANIVIGNKKYWGKRVPEEVVPALVEYLFTQTSSVKLKLETISSNRSSIASMKRCGAKQEGVLREEKENPYGERLDVCLFSILKSEWQSN